MRKNFIRPVIFSHSEYEPPSLIATSPFYHDYLLRDLLHYCHHRSKGIFKPYVGLYVGFNVCVCVYILAICLQ